MHSGLRKSENGEGVMDNSYEIYPTTKSCRGSHPMPERSRQDSQGGKLSSFNKTEIYIAAIEVRGAPEVAFVCGGDVKTTINFHFLYWLAVG